MKFADVFKDERKKRGYSQTEIAKLLNVTSGAIGMWEQGRRVPKLEKLEEIADLFNISLDKLQGKGDMFTAILVSSSCGLRRSELLAIKNDKEMFSKGYITVANAIVENERGQYVTKITKTYESQRTIKLPSSVKEHLLNLPQDKAYICEISPHNLSQGFNRLCGRVLDKEYTFHNLRHYYCSVLIAEGIPEQYAMKMMGHSTPNMIRQVYGHIMQDRQDCFDLRLDGFFSNNFTKNSPQAIK